LAKIERESCPRTNVPLFPLSEKQNGRCFVKNREILLGPVLLINGIVDLLCAAILLILPSLHKPILGYQVFDSQGAYMAGGWGIATLALGLTRIWASARPTYHRVMLLMGLLEGISLTIFSIIYLFGVHLSLLQVILPLTVGVVFGISYIICAVRKS